jgi:predicted restriction endonuclease
MQSDWSKFVVEAATAADSFGVAPMPEDEEMVADYTGSERPSEVMTRIGQGFFRRTVLSAYDNRCCITGLAVTALLTASHIVPWKVDASNRLNPRNGLCLSALHDRAFDCGIITISEDMTVRVSKSTVYEADAFFESSLRAYEGKMVSLPEKFRPDPNFLNYHREHVFKG